MKQFLDMKKQVIGYFYMSFL